MPKSGKRSWARLAATTPSWRFRRMRDQPRNWPNGCASILHKSMNASPQPAVFGATGYSGFELVRLLARHPGAKKPMLVRRNGESGGVADLSEAYPQLAGNGGYPFESLSWQRMKDAGVNVIFFATPHE